MAVRDKELIINGKAVRSPEQQVWQNMKDIEDLQKNIKPEYTTDAALTNASVSVALSDTNAPEGTTEGWLLTQDGLKFKITGGDDTNLLLEFYANLKGPQGIPGAAVSIDDTGTSLDKTWSSSKINTEIGKAKDKGVYYTTTQPTFNSGNYTLLANKVENGSDNLKNDDLILYLPTLWVGQVDFEIYKITNVATTLTLTKVFDTQINSIEANPTLDGTETTLNGIEIDGTKYKVGGKKYYQHNIRLYKSASSIISNFLIQIPNSSSEEMDASDILDFLNTNGYVKSDLLDNFSQNMYRLSGSRRDNYSSPQKSSQVCGIVYVDTTNVYVYYLEGNDLGSTMNLSTMTITDTVIEM